MFTIGILQAPTVYGVFARPQIPLGQARVNTSESRE
jgi:hypothetical protein